MPAFLPKELAACLVLKAQYAGDGLIAFAIGELPIKPAQLIWLLVKEALTYLLRVPVIVRQEKSSVDPCNLKKFGHRLDCFYLPCGNILLT